jgi:Raf kinase inhibitor-like YbhB/YbcL family protein
MKSTRLSSALVTSMLIGSGCRLTLHGDGDGGGGGGAPALDAAGGTGGEVMRDAERDPAIADGSAPDAASAERPLDAGADRSPDAADDTAATPDAGRAMLVLTSTGFLMKGGELIFPASASYPMDQSPPFAWSGAPASAKSFALTFVDTNNGATKWVLWDIPATAAKLPGNMSKTANPVEVPGSSQRGSLGRTGYSGPGVPGPPLHTYEFVLWALDVDKLPGTNGLTTVELRTKLLPAHAVGMSAPLVAKGQEGGP